MWLNANNFNPLKLLQIIELITFCDTNVNTQFNTFLIIELAWIETWLWPTENGT